MASSLYTRAGRVCIHVTQRQALSQRSQSLLSRTTFSKPHFDSIVVLTQFRYSSSEAAAAAASIVFPHAKNRSQQRLARKDLPQQGTTDTDKLRPSNTTDPETALDPGAPVDTPFDQPKLKNEAEVNGLPEFEILKGRISYDTLKAITVLPHKLTHMSPVQAEVLPLLPQIAEPYSEDSPADGSKRLPRDLLVKARTGTGKTLAFLVPAIEARLKAIEAAGKQGVKDAGLVSDKHLEGRVHRVFTREQVGTLIISPTRELATQIANEALRLTHHHKDFEVRLFVGGQSKRLQMRDWMKGRRDIVVATPGRLRDLLMSEPEIVRGISKTRTVSRLFVSNIYNAYSSLAVSSSSTRLIHSSTWVSAMTSTPLRATSPKHPRDKPSCSLQQSPAASNKSPVKLWTKTIFLSTRSRITIRRSTHTSRSTIPFSRAHPTKSLTSSAYLPMTSSLTPAPAKQFSSSPRRK